MIEISQLIDSGSRALSAEQIKLYAATQNIANVNNPSYVYQAANFKSIMDIGGDTSNLNGVFNSADYMESQRGEKVSLDKEVLHLTDSELRYQVIAQVIQRKFGMMDLVIGGKR